MALSEEEKKLIDKLAEILARANEQIDRAQIKRQLASYAEGIKAGVTIARTSVQSTI